MRKIYFLLVLLTPLLNVKAENKLLLRNTSLWLGNHTIGAIEDAYITVKPLGAYYELGIYMTFYSKGTSYQHYNENLEIDLKFELENDAIVTDSWLWIGDSIVKAEIKEGRIATDIYEGIVNRNKDPSLLKKITPSGNEYQLKVFPLDPKWNSESKFAKRKVKITVLQRTNFDSNGVFRCNIPMHLIGLGINPLSKVKIYAYNDTPYGSPSIFKNNKPFAPLIQDNQRSLFEVGDSNLKNKEVKIIYSNVPTLPKISLFKDSVNGELYYSLLYNPKNFFDSSLTNTNATMSMQLDIDSGFAYQKFGISSGENLKLDDIYHQCGKIIGKGNVSMKLLTSVNGDFYLKRIKVGNTDTLLSKTSNSIVETIWKGYYINALDVAAKTDSEILKVIKESVESRVLSSHTAFLALEFNDTIKPCLNCVDEGYLIISTQEELKEEEGVFVFPNQFSDYLSVKINMSFNYAQVKIIDLQGKIVKSVVLKSEGVNNEISAFKIDQLDEINSGEYIISINVNESTFSKRIIKH